MHQLQTDDLAEKSVLFSSLLAAWTACPAMPKPEDQTLVVTLYAERPNWSRLKARRVQPLN